MRNLLDSAVGLWVASPGVTARVISVPCGWGCRMSYYPHVEVGGVEARLSSLYLSGAQVSILSQGVLIGGVVHCFWGPYPEFWVKVHRGLVLERVVIRVTDRQARGRLDLGRPT